MNPVIPQSSNSGHSRYPKLLFCLLGLHLLKNRINQPIFSLLTLPLFLTFPASAATKTAITKSIIIGTAPYLTFDDGETKETDANALFTIKLSDGREFSQVNNPSTPANPIELPNEGETLVDVEMHIPIDKNRVNLSELITANNYWRDDDGDGVDGITITGSLALSIADSTGKILNRDDNISLCDGATYYKVVLSSTAGNLKTKYGLPNSSDFAASDITYYIKPKPTTKPYACFAQPNLTLSGSSYNGPANEWSATKGFKPQHINVPSSNFPTMGAHGLFFNLTIVNGGNWQSVSYDKSPNNSGIDITISNGGSTNVAKVLLSGPRYNTNNATTAVPTTFTLYSDKGKTNKLYTFTIGKWFIATPGPNATYSASYCVSKYGSKYRIPRVAEYTNANGNGWAGGLAGQPNNYQRRIGGGLFAEWGDSRNTEYYTGNDFDENDFYGRYWALEKVGTNQLGVYSDDGLIVYGTTDTNRNRFACVTP
ncbi:hypothetical protein PT276_03390 [Orbaceae bacterium ESL0721]|nr:hypothetical protein [Orbaceae bacterium ESL0721]